MSTTRLDMPDEYKLLKSTKKMQLFEKKGQNIIPPFVGSSIIESMFYLYLFKKYGSNCFLIDNFAKYAPQNNLDEILGLALPIRKYYTKEITDPIIDYMENIAKNLVKCIERDSEIIIIPLKLVFESDEKLSGHANILVYRKKYNHIEHFEPHGSHYAGKYYEWFVNSINKLLRIFVECINQELHDRGAFIDNQEKPIELIESDKVCPYLRGFQYHEEKSSYMKMFEKEGGGYCAAWSMFFTELCLRNPHMTSSEIISYVFNQDIKYYIGDYFRKIIRGYALFINEKIINYFSFLTDEPLNIELIKKIMDEKNNQNKAKYKELSLKMKIVIYLEMEMFFNPNVIEARINGLLDEIENNPSPDYLKSLNFELETIDKYRRERNNLKSPLNTDSFSNQPIKTKKEKGKQIVKECPPGKVLNQNTNRCNKIKTPKEQTKILIGELINKQKECPPGKILNPITNRCNKIKTITTIKTMKTMKRTMPKECPPGKVLNVVTNRCNKIKTLKRKPNK